jgi:hypothetical protein
MKQRGFWQLDDVSNERLVASLTELLTAEGRTEARIVAHLAELDARRLHLRRAQSLFDYCQRHLGLSENQAYFRIAAARVARRFPVVFRLLEQRAIHLTSVALLSKYLSEENHLDLLSEGQGLSKRALLEMLARRFPKADVASHVRALPVRPGTVAAGPTGTLEPLSEARYCLQLSTSHALKEKLELARDLMSHANPSGDIAVVVERGLDLLIAKLQQRRWGQTSQPRKAQRSRSRPLETELPQPATEHGSRPHHDTADRKAAKPPPELDRSDRSNHGGAARVDPLLTESPRFESPAPQPEAMGTPLPHPPAASRARSHIAHETRRQLVARDGLCCSYIGDDGARCRARAFLQIDHGHPWAKGGSETLGNLRLLCRAHNQLLAEQAFGKAHQRRAIADQRRCRESKGVAACPERDRDWEGS